MTTQGKTITSKVEWNADSLKNPGTAAVTGKLTNCNDLEISTTATVVPKNRSTSPTRRRKAWL